MSETEKQFKEFMAISIETDDDERTVTAVISTGSIDRDKEVMLPKGAMFENFIKNPIVLWGHSHTDSPIGKALWIKRQGGKIIAKTKFAMTQKAQEIYDLFKGGFLKAFSIGFIPVESRQPTTEDLKSNPDWAEVRRIISKWELLEYSAVPIPANPEALALAVKNKSITLSEETTKELDLDEIFIADDVVAVVPDKEPAIVTEAASGQERSIEIIIEEEKIEIEEILFDIQPEICVNRIIETETARAKGKMFA
jgi:HK97 family phage prohead protease